VAEVEAGQLRVFTVTAIALHGRLFREGQAILLMRRDEDPRFGRWHILIEGNEEICDEFTIERYTVESR
jgi:hypothetical protein